MTATRYLLAMLWAGVLGTAFAQTPPVGKIGPMPLPPPPPTSADLAQPQPQPPMPAPSATAILTSPPGANANLPPGSVASPWCGSGPVGAGCCGPYGANGPIVYELYARTGPNILVGETGFSGPLKNGWTVAGGGRTLLMDKSGDAAWVLDLGIGYTYNTGDLESLLQVQVNPRLVAKQQDIDRQLGRTTTLTLDTTLPSVMRRLMRTTFNYAVGRDWWLNGPGYVGAEQGWNNRVGFDVGGRWGTAHVDLFPQTGDVDYLRRQGVTQSVYLGAHWNTEVPMGAWILFGGTRVEWGKTWTNLMPPQDGDIQDINLLLTFGIRF
jgi:hypothetical protein